MNLNKFYLCILRTCGTTRVEVSIQSNLTESLDSRVFGLVIHIGNASSW